MIVRRRPNSDMSIRSISASGQLDSDAVLDHPTSPTVSLPPPCFPFTSRTNPLGIHLHHAECSAAELTRFKRPSSTIFASMRVVADSPMLRETSPPTIAVNDAFISASPRTDCVPSLEPIHIESANIEPHTRPWDSLLASLFHPIVALFNFFLMNSIVETDNFILRLRKVLIGAAAIGTIGYSNTIVDIIDDPSLPNWFTFLLLTIPCVSSAWLAFVYCRCTKTAPDWLFTMVSLVLVACRIPLAFRQSALDDAPTAMGYLLVVLVAHLPLPATIAASVLTTAALLINTLMYIKSTGVARVALLPGVDPNAAPDLTKHIINSRLSVLMIIFVIVVVIKKFNTLLKRSDEVVRMSQEMAHKLHSYDTDGVRQLLAEAQTLDFMNRDILAAFEGIVQNLEIYRPHLPNYLLSATGSAAGGTHDAEATTPISHPRDDDPEEERDDDSFALRDGADNDSTSSDLYHLAGLRSALSVHSTSGLQQGAKRGVKVAAVAPSGTQSPDPLPIWPILVGVSPAMSHRPSLLHPLSPLGGVGSMNGTNVSFSKAAAATTTPITQPPLQLCTMTRSRVSVCIAAFHWADPSSLSVSLVDALIGLISSISSETQASLHSFVGDRMIATWNGTKRIFKAESKACAFPLRIQTAIRQHTQLREAVVMSSMSGTRTANSCFAGDARLQLFSCSSPELWGTVSQGLARVQSLDAIAVDRSTKEYAEADVIFRGLTVLRTGTGRKVRVYQALHERIVDAAKDQEWMYALESNASDPSVAITAAFEAYADGKGSEAVALLNHLGPRLDDAIREPCVRWVVDEIRSARHRPSRDDGGVSPEKDLSLLGAVESFPPSGTKVT